MTRGGLVLAAGLLLGAALALLLGKEPAGPAARSAPGDPVTRAEVDELRSDLEFERTARTALAEEVAALRRSVDEVQAAGPGAGAAAAAPGAPELAAAAGAAGAAQETGAAAGPGAGEGAAADGDDGEPRFDTEALVRAGLPESEAERLRARWEAFELEKLELNDLGLREGWRGRRFRREHLALARALRDELGDEWDAYLYATGRENRLRVNDVLADSVASRVGFKQGDMILAYDGQRIYQPQDLQSRSAACPDGGFVTVEVMRDGRLERLRAPCGPLGVLVDHVKQPPLLP